MSVLEFLCAKYAGQTFRIDPRAVYSANHMWARRQKALATIGVSDHLRLRVAEGNVVEQKAVGTKSQRGAEIAQWDAIKALVSLLSPIAGTIAELNPALLKRPDLAGEDPYDKGWSQKVHLRCRRASPRAVGNLIQALPLLPWAVTEAELEFTREKVHSHRVRAGV